MVYMVLFQYVTLEEDGEIEMDKLPSVKSMYQEFMETGQPQCVVCLQYLRSGCKPDQVNATMRGWSLATLCDHTKCWLSSVNTTSGIHSTWSLLLTCAYCWSTNKDEAFINVTLPLDHEA